MFAVGNLLQLINEKIFHLLFRIRVVGAIASGGLPEECITYTPDSGIPLGRITALGWIFLLAERARIIIPAAMGPVADMSIIDEAAVQQNIEKLDVFNRADLYFPAA